MIRESTKKKNLNVKGKKEEKTPKKCLCVALWTAHFKFMKFTILAFLIAGNQINCNNNFFFRAL